jgi:arginine repressor
MKLSLIVKNVIQNNIIRNQTELCEILRKKEINATQSNISGVLRKINALKLKDEKGKPFYVIGQIVNEENIKDKLREHREKNVVLIMLTN